MPPLMRQDLSLGAPPNLNIKKEANHHPIIHLMIIVLNFFVLLCKDFIMKIAIFGSSLADWIDELATPSKSFYTAYKKPWKLYCEKKGWGYLDSQAKEYLNKIGKAIETKDYEVLVSVIIRQNKFSMAIFENETGLDLPSTNTGIKKVLQKYVGKKNYEAYENQLKQNLIDAKLRSVEYWLKDCDGHSPKYLKAFLLNKVSEAEVDDWGRKLTQKARLLGCDELLTSMPIFAIVDTLFTKGAKLVKRGLRVYVQYKDKEWKFPKYDKYLKYVFWEYEDLSEPDNWITDKDLAHLFGEDK